MLPACCCTRALTCLRMLLHCHNECSSCGGKTLPLDTLSGLLKTHTAADLYSRLKALLDLLAVSGPVTQLLPAMDSAPLRHAGVKDLHYQVLAHKAVNLMMDSTAYTSIHTGTQCAAVFLICATDVPHTSSCDVSVYAVYCPAPSGKWSEVDQL